MSIKVQGNLVIDDTLNVTANTVKSNGTDLLNFAQAAYNKANTGASLSGPVTLTNNNTISDANTQLTSTTANTVIDTYSISKYRTVKYLIQATDFDAPGVQTSEILVTHDDSNVYTDEFSSISSTGSSLYSLDASIDSANVYLMITPIHANTDIQFVKTSMLALALGGLFGDLLTQSGTTDLLLQTGSLDLNI
jgi:hypothetical protein